MSKTHGSNNNTAVVESFKEALKQRVGLDIFQAWFVNGVEFLVDDISQATESGNPTATHGRIVVEIRRQFALDRLRRNYLRQLRGAAAQVQGKSMEVELRLAAQPQQVALPLQASETTAERSEPTTSGADNAKSATSNVTSDAIRKKRQPTQSIAALVSVARPASGGINRSSAGGSNRGGRSRIAQPMLPNIPTEVGFPLTKVVEDKNSSVAPGDSPDPAANAIESPNAELPAAKLTLDNFVGGKCNQLARTATQLACESPGAASPLFLAGPPGVGKTHLLYAIANFLRRRQRMRRVIHLTAEKFTNDFVRSVSEHTLTTFRAKYRDADALIVDDVQFLSAKKATLREMLYTMQWLSDRGKTLVFAGSHTPSEISGLTQELAGRMSSGLVCTMQPLDCATRESLMRRYIEEHCEFSWPNETVHHINMVMTGDGRRILGVVRLVGALQRMLSRMPTMDEILQFGGEQLRGDKPTVTLSRIEQAVRTTFQLDESTLKSKSQARTATQPRMLAMYLSRELTPAALAEIGRFYGGRSHSAAILAIRRVESWLATGHPIGRGANALSARDALDRIESLLRSG